MTPAMINRHFGKYRGIVTSNVDPLMLGRLMAQVSDVPAATGWALPAAPYAGNGEGMFLVPQVGSNVWIEFEAGDPDRPIWSGGWWDQGQVPEAASGAQPGESLKILRSSLGLQIALDDEANRISISDPTGKNVLVLDIAGGEIRVHATHKVIIDAPRIELAQGAKHPAVLGDVLLEYLQQLVALFNSHTHQGQTAEGSPVLLSPPVPPVAPPTQLQNSNAVKVG